MANAFEALKVHVEASGWAFALSHLEEWRLTHPDGTIADYRTEVRRQTQKAKERFVEVEIENGATRESAERAARLMQ